MLLRSFDAKRIGAPWGHEPGWSSADFQSAVSQVSNLRTALRPKRAGGHENLPTGSRRYGRLEACATAPIDAAAAPVAPIGNRLYRGLPVRSAARVRASHELSAALPAASRRHPPSPCYGETSSRLPACATSRFMGRIIPPPGFARHRRSHVRPCRHCRSRSCRGNPPRNERSPERGTIPGGAAQPAGRLAAGSCRQRDSH